MGRNGDYYRFVAVILCVAVIGTVHDDTLIASFVRLHWTDARLIKNKNKKFVFNSPLLWSEERKNIV